MFRWWRALCCVLQSSEGDSVGTVVERRALSKVQSILDNSSHPLHCCSDRIISMCCRTERFRRSFILTAIRLFNSSVSGGGSWPPPDKRFHRLEPFVLTSHWICVSVWNLFAVVEINQIQKKLQVCSDPMCVCVCVFQVAAQAVLFMCMNTAGIFISYLSDRAQRQAFLETRRCIEARLRLETENQRQVSPQRNTGQSWWLLALVFHASCDASLMFPLNYFNLFWLLQFVCLFFLNRTQPPWLKLTQF